MNRVLFYTMNRVATLHHHNTTVLRRMLHYTNKLPKGSIRKPFYTTTPDLSPGPEYLCKGGTLCIWYTYLRLDFQHFGWFSNGFLLNLRQILRQKSLVITTPLYGERISYKLHFTTKLVQDEYCSNTTYIITLIHDEWERYTTAPHYCRMNGKATLNYYTSTW